MGFGSDWKQFIEENDDRIARDTGSAETDQKRQYRSKRAKAIKAGKDTEYQIFCALCDEHDVPRPEREHVFHDTRKWRLDYAWVDQKVAIEVQGGIWQRGRHSRGTGYLNDMHKLNEAQLYGWIVLQVQPDDLNTHDTIKIVQRAHERSDL